MRRAVLAVLALAACSSVEQGGLDVPAPGQLADYRAYVHPVLAAGCASLDCHGQPGRPMRLYAKHGLRLEASLRGQDERDDELIFNMKAIAALDPEVATIADHLLLLKPLAVAAGGLHHLGGDLWPSPTDPAYRCLEAWLRTGASDVAGRAACTEAVP